MNLFSQGLAISISGILITFTALGVFILIMFVLQRIFPSKVEGAEVEVEAESAPAVSIEMTEDSGRDAEVAAAIAVAISYFRSLQQSQLGSSLERGKGSWWAISQAAARQKSVKGSTK